MQRKNFKGRCEKISLKKCQGVCRTYGEIQFRYAQILNEREDVKEFACNVPLNDEDYTTDFVITQTNGEILVRECVQSKYIAKPMTVKMLDTSLKYWQLRGVEDWGLVTDEEQ